MRTIQSAREMADCHLSHPVVFVPTMGALHAGHVALIREARRLAGTEGSVVVSIFVNPTQFGPGEDLDAYPRPLESDLAQCREAKVDVVFYPSPEDIYLPGHSVSVSESSLSKRLCGASRPGHFDGVCTVVLKLFHLVRPDVAVFGKKDYQQLAIIRRMTRDLNVPVEIVGVETVRDSDGLARSSRNVYLNERERAQAPAIRAALLRAAASLASGITDAARLRAAALADLKNEAPSGTVDYLEIVDAGTLEPLDSVSRPAVLAVAFFLGRTRLIDNIELTPPAVVPVDR